MVTIGDLAFYLIDKKEHYPLSDAFTRRYQNPEEAYINFARRTGHPVDRQTCEPNQKWHFFESWLIRTFQDGTLGSWDDDAARIWSNKGLQCPELLLWLLEAIHIDSSLIEAAKEIAEHGRDTNTRACTIAKEIRQLIPWKTIENAVKNEFSVSGGNFA